nr:uncharacterized protein LOC121132170 [Lepeophtheirus salmonis]
MICKILIISVVVVLASAQDITLKAPSLAVNCGCQCSNYIFQDVRGITQGNCNSADQTGAKWCYVDRGHTCQDTIGSARNDQFGRRRQISYEACATPNCGGGFLG